MGIDVTLVTETDTDDWMRCIESSPMATPFHHPDALSVLDDHSDSKLHRVLGMNGAEPTAAFPVFELNRPLATILQSPPWILKSMPLGPALANLEKMKSRRAERYRAEFVEESLALLAEEIGHDGLHVRTDTRMDDIRAFRWAGLELSPYQTYEVDLRQSTADLLARFSSDARKNVRNTDSDRYEVTVGDVDDIEFVIEQVSERYANTEGRYRLTTEFVTDLYEALSEDVIRPYILTVGGERATGMVTLWFGDRVYRWQGGVRTEFDLPTSDLLDWHIMREAIDEDMVGYDLVGANDRRLSRYKSKFGPELQTYYNVRGGNRRLAMSNGIRTLLGTGYQTIRDRIDERSDS